MRGGKYLEIRRYGRKLRLGGVDVGTSLFRYVIQSWYVKLMIILQ